MGGEVCGHVGHQRWWVVSGMLGAHSNKGCVFIIGKVAHQLCSAWDTTLVIKFASLCN